MKEDAEELGLSLKEKFGEQVDFRFIDIASDEIGSYPEIKEILNRVRLPLTVINGAPRFHGGLAQDMIEDAVESLMAE